jgi:soluble lytic murein transglycosylase
MMIVGLALMLGCGGWWFAHWWTDHRFDGVIGAAARRYGMDPALIKAVVWKESRFRHHAVGRAGELGLMQLMDAAAQEWAESEKVYPLPEPHLLDPATNTLAGTWYLRKVLQRYQRTDNPVAYALADYNAGRGNVLKWALGPAATNSAAFLESIRFPSTRQYILAILERRQAYQPDFAPLPLAQGAPQPLPSSTNGVK